jgi:hypothetical protein
MGFCYCAIAVRAPRADVLAATTRYFAARGGDVTEAFADGRRDSAFFAVGEHAGFTVLAFAGAGVPARLARRLSCELACEVVEVDHVESVGYAHFAWLDRGRPCELYTTGLCEDELELDRARYAAAAAQIGLDDDPYPLFVTIAGPLPIEDIALELVANAGPGYRYTCPDGEAELLGSSAQTTWRALTA